jgi:hypothetical protein
LRDASFVSLTWLRKYSGEALFSPLLEELSQMKNLSKTYSLNFVIKTNIEDGIIQTLSAKERFFLR